jgi:L-alanine-DL-glutamate epimerase-like enolase superfamily enzyme
MTHLKAVEAGAALDNAPSAQARWPQNMRGGNIMKITKVQAYGLHKKLDTTYWISTAPIANAHQIIVKVETDEGITGLATLHGAGMKTVCAMVEALNVVVVGMDALAHEAVWQKIFAISTMSANPADHSIDRSRFPRDERALLMRALAGIDIALWDIKGKAFNLPVYKLLGGTKNKVPAYMTGGYYQTNRDILAFNGELAGYVEAGYSAVKIKIAGIPIEQEIGRLATARRELGPDCRLMLDANNGYSLPDAIRAIRAFEQFDITWFEEPVHWYDSTRALGKLAQATHVPIASGESEIHGWACRDLVDLGGIRIMQFDAARAGGVTEWLRVASYCHFHGVTMSTHHEPHIHGHLAAAVPNGGMAETFSNANRDPFWYELFTVRAEVVKGEVVLNDLPGFGFELDWKVVEKYAT